MFWENKLNHLNFDFHAFHGASKGFMKAFKAFNVFRVGMEMEQMARKS